MRRIHAFAALCAVLALGCDSRPAATRLALATESDDALALRRVWSDARDYATPSPDGRQIAFVDWATGDVAVHELATGTARHVTNKGSWQPDGSWAEVPRFAPDGRRLVYTWGNALAARPFVYELRVVALDDPTPTVLHTVSGDAESIYALDWHERAGILAIVDRAGGASDLVAIDPETRAVRAIRTFRPEETDPHRGGFSRDGRFIVYQYGRELRVMDAAGANDRGLDEQGTLLGWTPDGSGVLLHADREGRRAIWLVPMRDGRRAGATTLVRDGVPMLVPGGFSRDAYFFSVAVDGPKLQLATVDVENARVLVPPVAITTPAEGFAEAPAWSPDGTSYAYILSPPAGRRRIMIRSADGEQLREVGTLDVGRVRALEWTSDGRALIVAGNGTADVAAYRIDIATGETTKLFEPAGLAPRLTPDGRTLVYMKSQGVFARAVEGGPERAIVEVRGGNSDIAISPDGRTLAHVRGRGTPSTSIVLLPIDGGEERVLLRAAEGSHFESMAHSLAFTPDGRHLIAVMGDDGGPHRIVAIPLAGGAPRTLIEAGTRREGAERAHARLHPDGRRLLYSTGEGRSEMWMLEDVPGALPAR
jgi:Tol biopolymer transport system component